MTEKYRILCYGDSNTWGADKLTGNRFAADVRWTGVLQNQLGDGYCIIEEGLGGHTTVRDDPYEPFRNGRDYLRPCLLSHDPLDLVIIMLGTNDLKSRFNITAEDIGRGVALLCTDVRQTLSADIPILIVSPAPLGDTVDPDDMFGPGIPTSRLLGDVLKNVATESETHFFDAGSIITLNHSDGIHLNAADNLTLGTSLAKLIPTL